MPLFLHLQSHLALKVVLNEPLIRVAFDRLAAGHQDLPLDLGVFAAPVGRTVMGSTVMLAP